MSQQIDIVINWVDRASGVLAWVQSGVWKFAWFVAKGMLAAGAAIWVAGAAGLKSAGEFEQTAAAFETMLWNAADAKILLKDLSKFAAETPFEFPELASAGKSLLAFGFQAKDVQGTLRRLWDISSAINIPIGDLSELYGKARVQGRLFAEDINQLTWRGIPIIQEFAKQFGVSEKEVKKLVESWKIGFPELEKAIVSMTDKGGQFAGGMVKQSTTLNGLVSTAQDAIGSLLRQMVGISETGEIMAGSLIERIKSLLVAFIDFTNKNQETIKQFLDFVMNAFQFAFSTIANIVQFFTTWATSEFSSFFTSTKASVQIALAAIVEFWNQHGEDILTIVKFIWDRLSKIIQATIEFIGPLVKWLGDVIGGVLEFISWLIKWDASKAWSGLGELVKWVATIVTEAIYYIFNTIAAIFGTSIPEILESLKTTFGGAWEWINTNVSEIVTAMSTFISSTVDAMFGKITKFIDDAKNAVEKVKSFFSSLTESVAKAGRSIGSSVYEATHSDGVAWARANGWPVGSGKTYLVGERWPELFTPNRSWFITPNEQLGSKGGSVSNSIAINLGGVTVRNDADIEKMVFTIKQELARSMEIGRLGIS